MNHQIKFAKYTIDTDGVGSVDKYVIAGNPHEAFYKFEDEHGISPETIKLECFLNDDQITFRGWDN